MHNISIAALFATAAVATPLSAQVPTKGVQVFQRCAACHTDRPGAMGPTLHGIVGRPAGSVPGFHYSSAMQHSGLTWTPKTLRRYLTSPQGTVPGNRMPMAPLSPADADAVIPYLATLK